MRFRAGGSLTHGRHQANVRLIAASPDMYDFIEKFLSKLLYTPSRDPQVVMKFDDLNELRAEAEALMEKVRGGQK